MRLRGYKKSSLPLEWRFLVRDLYSWGFLQINAYNWENYFWWANLQEWGFPNSMVGKWGFPLVQTLKDLQLPNVKFPRLCEKRNSFPYEFSCQTWPKKKKYPTWKRWLLFRTYYIGKTRSWHVFRTVWFFT